MIINYSDMKKTGLYSVKGGEVVKHAAVGKENHQCEREENAIGTIFKEDDGWNIQIEEYGDIEPIKYCPYCGIKLG